MHTDVEPVYSESSGRRDSSADEGQWPRNARGGPSGSAGPGEPAFALELVAERRSAVVRSKAGTAVELTLSEWTEVLALLEQRVAALPGLAADPAKPKFGPKPGRHGADWSTRESGLLSKEFESGIAIAALALAHQRSTGAVEAQLVKLGLLAYADCQYSGPPRRY